MRTRRRLAVVSAVLGGGLLLAAPAAAVEADCDAYPDLAECVIDEPIDGGDGGAGTGDDEDDAGGDGGAGSDNAESDNAESDNAGSDNAGGAVGGGSSGGAATLPMTGGEVTLIALAGTAAVGGGIALTAAGRKRATV